MSQSDLNIANADGATVRADINSQLEALVTQSSGAEAPPVTFPFMRWFDTSAQQLKERNSANTTWRIVAEVVAGELVPYSLGVSVGSNYLKGIGEYFGLLDHLTGVDVPDNSGSAKFIRLTAGQDGSGGYNEGLLINESITGSAPLVEATAEIATGPLAGQVVHLWNTEGRYHKPGVSSGSVANDKMQQITGEIEGTQNRFRNGVGAINTGALVDTPVPTGGFINRGSDLFFNSANSPDARTADHTDVKHEQVTYYLRIA